MRVGVLGLQGQREVFIPAPSLYSEQQTNWGKKQSFMVKYTIYSFHYFSFLS